MYSNGESERIIGKALKKFDIPRSKVFILTKAYGAVAEQTGLRTMLFRDEIATSKDYVNQHGERMPCSTRRWAKSDKTQDCHVVRSSLPLRLVNSTLDPEFFRSNLLILPSAQNVKRQHSLTSYRLHWNACKQAISTCSRFIALIKIRPLKRPSRLCTT